MCYCEKPDIEIGKDLKSGTVPDDALLRNCCWRKICKVRGKWFQEIGDLAWSQLCDKRAELSGKEQRPHGNA